MGVTANEQGNTVTIKVDGRFDFSAHQDFISSYRELPKGEKSFMMPNIFLTALSIIPNTL